MDTYGFSIDDLMLDTGANATVVHDKALMSTWRPVDDVVIVQGVEVKEFEVKGMGFLKAPLDKIECYYIPSFPSNVVSEAELREKYVISFVYAAEKKEDRVIIASCQNGLKILDFSRRENNLFYAKLNFNPTTKFYYSFDFLSSINKDTMNRMRRVNELHRRTAYLSLERLYTLVKENVALKELDLGAISHQDVEFYRTKVHESMCTACRLGKTKAAPASTTDHLMVPHEIGKLHADIMSITHTEGTYLYLAAVDQQSGMTFAILLNDSSKEEVEKAFELVHASYLRYGHTLREVCLDNEKSFEAASVRKFLHSRGVNTAPCPTGRHTRRAEVQIRTIKYTFRALIMGLAYPLPIKLYPWAVRWAVESINLTLKSGNDRITPLHAFTDQRTDFQRHFKAAFGDIVTTRLESDESKRPKTNGPSQTFGIILGRVDSMRGTHIIMDLSSKHLIKRMHFKVYPTLNATIIGRINSIGYGLPNTEFGHVIDSLNNLLAEESDPDDNHENNIDEPESNNNDEDIILPDDSSESDESEGIADLSSDEELESTEEGPGLIARKAPLLNRLRRTSTEGRRTDERSLEELNTDSQLAQSPRRTRWKPTNRILEMFQRSTLINDDMSISQALKIFDPSLVRNAVAAEIQNMYDGGVWEYSNRNEAKGRLIPSFMFLKPKYSNSEFVKLKARLVACGNLQKQEEQLAFRNSSPTASLNTLFLVVAVAAKNSLHISACDITAAYLNADLDESIFMKLNKEISDCIRSHLIVPSEESEIIVKLKKSLYGLKQSGKNWYKLLKSTLKEFGLIASEFDPCLMMSKSKDFLVGIYVDDLLIASADSKRTQKLYSFLTQKFKSITIQEGPNVQFLGLQITKDSEDYYVSQEEYIKKISDEDSIETYPYRQTFKSDQGGQGKPIPESSFKSVVMKLMYIATRTRPDILFATSVLATRQNPTTQDFTDAKRIMRYLRSTLNQKLAFRKRNEFCMKVYCDASFSCHADRRSHSGHTIFIDEGSAAIQTKSYKQKVLATSTMEAELIALFEAERNAIFIKQQLTELGIQIGKIKIYEDNMPTIQSLYSENNMKGNSKFIDRRYFSIRDDIATGDIEIEYIGTNEQIADALTKAVIGGRFFKFRNNVMGHQN